MLKWSLGVNSFYSSTFIFGRVIILAPVVSPPKLYIDTRWWHGYVSNTHIRYSDTTILIFIDREIFNFTDDTDIILLVDKYKGDAMPERLEYITYQTTSQAIINQGKQVCKESLLGSVICVFPDGE